LFSALSDAGSRQDVRVKSGVTGATARSAHPLWRRENISAADQIGSQEERLRREQFVGGEWSLIGGKAKMRRTSLVRCYRLSPIA
jgi:hypothetical protein